MKKFRLIALTLVIVMVLSASSAFACTGVYVGKDVSAEGTTVIARSEDQGSGAYNKLFLVQPRVTKAGRYYVVEGVDQNGFKVPLPKTTYKYTYMPDSSDLEDGQYPASCTNEYGVAVVGTVSASPSEAYNALDPFNETGTGLREAILPGLIACQVKTAREAVETLGELVDTYGSEEGNILFFSDPKEAWIFEIYGGSSYAAMKMPADKVSVFGNHFMIDVVDQNDTENFFFSDNLFDLVDKVGAVKEDGKYNLLKSISDPVRDEYSNMRNWIGMKVLAPSLIGDADYSDNELYPLFYSPDDEVSILEVMDIYRNRYEGTKYDMMLEENEARRPIGVTRQSVVHAIQTYADMPKDSCQLQWLSMGNAEHNVFVPAFSGITDTFEAYKVDKNVFTEKSFYFAMKRITGIAEMDRAFLGQGVKDFWNLEEEMMLAQMEDEMDNIKAAYAKSKTAGRKYVTNLGKKVAKLQYTNSENLFNNLLFTAINNVNDRANNARKKTFVADTRMTKAAEFKGYEVTRNKKTKTYTLKDEDTTIKIKMGEKAYTVKENGKTTTLEMTKAPYTYGGYLYVPMTFIDTL